MINPLVLNPTARELVDTVNEVIAEVNAGGTPAPVPATHPLNATETEIGIGQKLTASEADQKGSYVTTDPAFQVSKSMSVSGFSTGAYSDVILMTGKKVFEVIPVCPAIAGTGGDTRIYLLFGFWDVSSENSLFYIPIISLASGGFTICGVSVPSIPSRLRVVIDSTNMPTSAEYSVYDGSTLIFTDTIGHPPESGEIAMKFVIIEEPAVGGPGGGGGLTFSIQTITDSSLFLTPLGVGETDIDGNEGAPSSGIPEAPIDGQQYARKDGGWEVVVSGNVPIATDTNLLVPSQYATVQAAVDYALGLTVQDGAKVTIVIDSSHTITSQVVVKNGDYKWLHITTTGGTVSVDSSAFVVNTPFGAKPLFYFENTWCQVSGVYSHTAGPFVPAIFSYVSTVAIGTGFVPSTFTGFGEGYTGAVVSFFSDVGIGGASFVNCKSPALYLTSSKCRWDTGTASLDTGVDTSLFVINKSDFTGAMTQINAQSANNSAVYCMNVQSSRVNISTSSLIIGNSSIMQAIKGSDVYFLVTNTLNINWTSGSNSAVECYSGSKVYMQVTSVTGTPSTAFIGEVGNGSTIYTLGMSPAYTGGYSQAVNIPTNNGLIFGS